MFNTKIRCCTFLQAYISIFILFIILFLLQCEIFFLLMLSKTVMFRLMKLRMRILSSPPPSFVAAAPHITLHLPSLVDESSLPSSNGKISKYDFLCQDLLGIYDLSCVLLLLCVIIVVLFCLMWIVLNQQYEDP